MQARPSALNLGSVPVAITYLVWRHYCKLVPVAVRGLSLGRPNGFVVHDDRVPRPKFFLQTPLPPNSNTIMKLIKDQISPEKGTEIFQKCIADNELHWSIYGSYVSLLMRFKKYDKAMEVMREGIKQSSIHPQLYNHFLQALIHSHDDMVAFNFLKEICYTPYKFTVDNWVKHLTHKGVPKRMALALELANFLVTQTSFNYADSYHHIYLKYLQMGQFTECFEIVKLFHAARQNIPHGWTIRLLDSIVSGFPDSDLLPKLIDLTTTDLFIELINWHRHSRNFHFIVPIFDLVRRKYPDFLHACVRSQAHSTIIRLESSIQDYLKNQHKSNELVMCESDSLFLSALASIPNRENLLPDLVAQKVPIHPIYFEYQLEHLAATDPDPEASFALYVSAMTKYGIKPSPEMNRRLIQKFLSVRKFQRAQDLFAWMRTEELDTRNIYLVFALYHTKHEEPEDALNVVIRTMPEHGVVPTMNEFYLIIEGLAKNGHMKQARIVIRAMDKVGLKPNIPIHCAMLQYTFVHEGADDALILLEKMRKKWFVKTDKQIYTVVLEKLIETNALQDNIVDGIRNMMRREYIVLDMKLYNLLLDAYLRTNNDLGASRLLKRMISVGEIPDIATYKILLRHHTITRNNEKLISTVWEIKNQDRILPGTKVQVVKALLSADLLEVGYDIIPWECVHLLSKKQVNRDMCDMLLYAACWAKHYNLASKLLRKCKVVNFLPSPSLVNVVLERMRIDKYDHTSLAAELGIIPSVVDLPTATATAPITACRTPPSVSVQFSDPLPHPPASTHALPSIESFVQYLTPLANLFPPRSTEPESARPHAQPIPHSAAQPLAQPTAHFASQPLVQHAGKTNTQPTACAATPSATQATLRAEVVEDRVSQPNATLTDAAHPTRMQSRAAQHSNARHSTVEDASFPTYMHAHASHPRVVPSRTVSYEFHDELAGVRAIEKKFPSQVRDDFKITLIEEVDEDEYDWMAENEENEEEYQGDHKGESRLRRMLLALKLR